MPDITLYSTASLVAIILLYLSPPSSCWLDHDLLKHFLSPLKLIKLHVEWKLAVDCAVKPKLLETSP